MKTMRVLLAALSTAALAGCQATNQRVEGLAAAAPSSLSASATPSAFPGMDLAVVYTANTVNAMKTAIVAEKDSAYMEEAPNRSVPDGEGFTPVLDALRRNFRSVNVVDSIEQAVASGADLYAVLDVFISLPPQPWFVTTKFDMRADFHAMDGSLLAKVQGYSQNKPGSVSALAHGSIMVARSYAHALKDATSKFDAALDASQELKSFASSLPAKPAVAAVAVAAAPAASPAAPVFRSDVDNPGYRLPEDESKFALVVGVERYQALPAADHAVRDARAVKAHLLAAGYPERNIVFLTDAQAGRSGLDKYLDAWLPKNTDERSTVLFYFSGHGAPEPAKGDAYLMPWDADSKFVESTGYPVKRLYQRLEALKAKRVLVAMDACFSGAGGRSVIAKGLRPLVVKVDMDSSSRVASLTASAGDEVTGTDESSGHGLFTYHFLKGLSVRGGRATFKDLYDYLSPKVRDAARRDNRDQTPQLSGAAATPL